VQFLFADHVLDTDRRELRHGAEAVSVEPQVLDLLICLVENRNRVVTKDDLIALVWRGRIVSDATLTSRIYAARKAVGDTGQDQNLIRTVSRKGLRFVGDVSTRSEAGVAVDPYTGTVLGVPRGTGFFEGAEQLHRNLAAGPVGKQIVGASTAMLIVLALSGLYLRWLRRPRSLSAWFRFDFSLSGRAFMWRLHAVAGTWLLLFYLLAALTGLWWSYDFYRAAVNRIAGVTTPARRPPQTGETPPLPIDRAWLAFRNAVPDATRATVALSGKTDAPLEIRYLTATSPHDRAFSTLKVDAASGEIAAREPYAELPRGRRFVSSIFPLHSGSFFGTPGRVLVALAALLMPFFAVTGIWLWMLRRRSEAARTARLKQPDPVVAIAQRSFADSPATDLRAQ